MILEKPNEYKFIQFQKSKNKNKKYDAILMHKTTHTIRVISFGDVDTTGLGIYTRVDNNEYYRSRQHGR